MPYSVAQLRFGHHLSRWTDGQKLAVAHERHPGGVDQGVIRAMGRHHHRQTLRGEAGDDRQHQGFVVKIQMRGRLVEQNHRWLLGERARDQDQLPLAAAQLGIGLVAHVLHADQVAARRRPAACRAPMAR